MKRMVALLLVLAMVFALCACGKVEKNDEGFLKNLQRGLEQRLSMVDKSHSSTNGVAGIRDNYANCVRAELSAIGNLSEYTFSDSNLASIAERYVETLNTELEGISYFNVNHTKYSEIYYSEGYYPQAELLCELNKKYGLEVGSSSVEKFAQFLEDGRLFSALKSLLPSDFTLESLGGNKSEFFLVNNTDYDFSGARVLFNFYNDDGVLVDSSSSYFESWRPGSKNRATVYSQDVFSRVEAAVAFNMGNTNVSTEFAPIEYVNNMIIELELVTELPQELSYRSTRQYYTKGIVKTFSYEEGYWNDGVGSLKIHISGEKTYDKDHDKGTRACRFAWKVYDEEGVVIDTGSFYTSDLREGETFKDAESSVHNLEPGKYYIEITDYNS